MAPTLTWVTEFGVSLTDKLDISLLMAPQTSETNSSSVPPQGSVSYRLTPNASVSASMDTDQIWQSKLQVFFRF